MKIIVTGGLGFIGSSVIRNLINKDEVQILNLDKSTYAANPEYLDFLNDNDKYKFQQGDIADKELIENLLKDFKPEVIMNLAAETHVDRSINNPEKFIHTNIIGTFNLLECTRNYLNSDSINVP